MDQADRTALTTVVAMILTAALTVFVVAAALGLAVRVFDWAAG